MPKPSANRTVPMIGPGSPITLHLEIRLPDGTKALSTWGEDPLAITLGDGTLAPGLEALLAGLAAGAEERFLVSGDEVYGPRDPDNIHWLPLADFPPSQATAPGQVVAFDTPGGHELAGVVLEVNADRVRVDLNHPLSGKPLDIRVQVLSVEGGPEAAAADTVIGQVRVPGLSSES
jgi:FKBP-type peptidyl-prolyl cis-trans isomerase SlpA